MGSQNSHLHQTSFVGLVFLHVPTTNPGVVVVNTYYKVCALRTPLPPKVRFSQTRKDQFCQIAAAHLAWKRLC